MCGFAGIIKLDKIKRDNTLNKRMNAALNSLYPRGPNQKGEWIDDYSYIVHSRLSILDLSAAGIQPMHKYGKVIVFNGEIYNFKEIRKELKNKGYKFNSSTDCEVLLAGWDSWGVKILDRIKGMFAFVIWDIYKKKAYLVRDCYGKKPLLYLHDKNFIAFASDLKALEKITDCGSIDPLAVQSLFKLRFINEPLTIYKNAKKVPAGSIAVMDDKAFSIEKWYNIPRTKELYSDKDFIKKGLIKTFDSAVNSRLVSDVPVGIFLSGGLDSSLIVASLAEFNNYFPCFTMGFKDSSSYYEERPAAARLAKYFGMKHHSLEISTKHVLKNLPNFFEACDEPFADSSAIPLYFLAQEVKKSVTVAISGDGGDEIFGGYRKYLGERWARLGNAIPYKIRTFIANILSENKDTHIGELSRRIRRFLLNVSAIPSERQASWLEQINEDDIKKLLGASGPRTNDILVDYRYGFDDSINSMLAGDIGFSLPGDMLVKLDRMSMANSLEVRSPFLDRELVELAFKLPGKYKVGMFKGKKILREAFSNRLPEWSVNLPKKGFEIPIANWLSKDLKPLLNKTCNSKNLEKIGIANTSIVENWKKNLFAGKKDTSWQLWTLLVYDQWLKARGLF